MNILTILILWAIGCIALCLLNARFWKLMPDKEGNEGQVHIAPIKPLYKPLKKGLNWMDWITIIVVLAVLFSCVTPMRSGYYTISEVRGINTVVLKEEKVIGTYQIQIL